MRILLPNENALFMRNWRAKTRAARLIPMVLVLLLVLTLVVFQCYWTISMGSEAARCFRAALGVVIGIQAFVLLLVGAYEVGSAAYQEARTGTIDFHRASATSPLNQMLGLLFGGALSSYILFAVMIPVAFFLASSAGMEVGTCLLVQVSLIVSGIFYHGFAALAALRGERKFLSASSPASGAAFVIIAHAAGASLLPALWSLPAYVTSLPVIVSTLNVAPRWMVDSRFYGVTIPIFLLQAIVQVPLIFIIMAALLRAMKHSSRPAISKGLALALAVILFALGSSGAYGPTMKGAAFGIQLASLLFAFILGAILLAAVTPSYALFCQGLRRRKKLGGAPANFFNDYAGNSLWAVLYAMMAVGFFVLVAHGKGDSMLRLSLVTTLLYFGWLAGAMEYFSLGPNKGRGPLPLATITILWLIVPAFGFMPAASLARFEWWASGLMGTCPFFGIPFLAIQEAARMVGFRNLAPDAAPAPIWAALSVNAVLLIAFQYLAFSARAETAKRVEAQSAP